MNVIKNPAIEALDPENLCYGIYRELYNQFFNAQQKKDEEHPYGIEEGDEVSIRLHNTAYGFAYAIAGAVTGTGGGEETGGILLDYLKKSGGDMSGMLRTNYGFEAGHNNNRILHTFQRTTTHEGGTESEAYGVKLSGILEVGGTELYIGGKNILGYDSTLGTVTLSGEIIDFGASLLKSSGEFIIGESKEKGIYFSPAALHVNGNPVFHSGNANLEAVDWIMRDGIVSRNLIVKGTTKLSGKLTALEGFELGINNAPALSVDAKGVVQVSSFLSFSTGYGIQIAGAPVLIRANEKDVQLGAVSGDLLLGSLQTHKIKLLSNLLDTDGKHVLLSRYGAAYFPDSLMVRHNYGDELLSSYRKDSTDEGMVIHKRLRFGGDKAAYLTGESDGIVFVSVTDRTSSEIGTVTFTHATSIRYNASTSLYKPLNRDSNTLFVTTDADFISFNKPVESKDYIGIDGSFTRLTNKYLFFTNESYLQAITGGVKHGGNAFFTENLSSEKFSSGFAGTGWSITRNPTTGSIIATFDEVTIRKKQRVYELEVQKNTATNGSLWITDSCSGDTVEQIN